MDGDAGHHVDTGVTHTKGPAAMTGPTDASRVEAPVTLKAYMMCAFAAFGGVSALFCCFPLADWQIFFGYDSGYISGVMGMRYFITLYTGLDYETTPSDQFTLPARDKSLITSILSAGTFFGALIGGDLADWFGRRITIIAGCAVFIVGVILQTVSTSLGLMVAGRLIAGFGVGFVSAIIILYMSEIAPRKIRGAIGKSQWRFPTDANPPQSLVTNSASPSVFSSLRA